MRKTPNWELKNTLDMKGYKILRKVLAVSAMTSAMFVMQACYGTPVQQGELYDDDTVAVSDTDEATTEENTVVENVETAEIEPVAE